MKMRTYDAIYANAYFWRAYNQQEIDLVEEREGRLIGYETKWSLKKRIQPPNLWAETYPNAEFEVITPDNYLEFVTY